MRSFRCGSRVSRLVARSAFLKLSSAATRARCQTELDGSSLSRRTATHHFGGNGKTSLVLRRTHRFAASFGSRGGAESILRRGVRSPKNCPALHKCDTRRGRCFAATNAFVIFSYNCHYAFTSKTLGCCAVCGASPSYKFSIWSSAGVPTGYRASSPKPLVR